MDRRRGNPAVILPQIDEHLVEDQKGRTGGNHDKDHSTDENYRTIATRHPTLRTMGGELGIEDLDELFWCCLAAFGFFHVFQLRPMFGATLKERAYLAPFLAFLLALALGGVVAHFGEGRAFWVFSESRYWVYPFQTALCGGLLVWGWRWYEFKFPKRIVFTAAIGVLALLLWIAPQEWFGASRRMDGFDPGFFGATGWPYALNLTLRLVRLVIVVPLLEEIFWRGFLLRYLIDEDFARVPIGTFSWLSFAVVTAGFTFEHAAADWPSAALTGALYNLVAYRTRSLSACVLTHAVTNLLLGGYILRTGQWGFW